MTNIALCPAQQTAYNMVQRALPLGSPIVVFGHTGQGKTTILRELHRNLGGAFLTTKDFTDAIRFQNPLAIEETFDQVLRTALSHNEVVIMDDFHLIGDVICGCGGWSAYPRPRFLNAALTAILAYAAETNKRLIFGIGGNIPDPIRQRAFPATIPDYEMADYRFLCQAYFDRTVASNLDYEKIFRFAPKLQAHQIKSACLWLRPETEITTERFIDYLRSQRMASNVDLGEVRAVDLRDLKGIDDVIRDLEANIILPLENDELAQEMQIKPKRGVLLAGPPGTGKTTVGRALAHRLKSKFFLIDGTFISGTDDFYKRIHQIFEAAKNNAPCIIFIDDSDVIFESGEELGLYRYLLTMLDGLESESAEQICVMLTAMNVGSLPPALIRSGRIELWLETRLPDLSARLAILRELILGLPSVMGDVDADTLADATEGLTGADLKRLIEDGKILYAYDKAQKVPLRSATDYFLAAVETVLANKQRYAEAEANSHAQSSANSAMFGSLGAMMAHAHLNGDEE
jgi:transitional endoplasmic reticulum ATPase